MHHSPAQPGRVGWRNLALLHGTLFLYAVVSIFAKLAGLNMEAQDTRLTFLFLGLEVLTLLVYSVLWQQTLKRMPLNFAYSNKGVCTLWTYLFGLIFFGAKHHMGKAAGLLVVLAGVLLVVTDHE